MLNRNFWSWQAVALMAIIFLWIPDAGAINPPQPKCAAVQAPNGEVDITWQSPEDPDGIFHSYVLYVVDFDGDPEIIFETTDYNINSYTHVPADAQESSRTYFIRVRTGPSGTDETAISDSTHTMLLEVSAANGGALAVLSWNKPFEPITGSSFDFYEIYRENAPGNWVLIGTTPYGEESFVDTVNGLCYDPPENINYRVEISDTSGCTSVSSIDGDELTDGTGPTPPVIETVSIDPLTGHVIVCWYPSPEPDTQGYIIQDNTTEGNYITVGNIDSTTFIHTVSPSEPRRYLVIAYDSCGNDESFGVAHETMHLTVQLRECDQEVDLAWTPYVGWEEGVMFYEVQASENGSNYETIFTNSPGNREETYAVNPFSGYCFRVRAVSEGSQKASFSTTECLEITYPQTPEYVYLNQVDVTPENIIEVRLLPDENAFQMEYRLERKGETDNDFEEIGNMLPFEFEELYRYTDEDVFPEERNYEYRVAAYDHCQNFDSYSNISVNMRLTATANDNFAETATDDDYLSKLQWNHYESWNGGVAGYQIYRSLGSDGDFEPLATVSPNTNYYEDNVFDLIDTHGEFCYYIEAREHFNEFDRADTVRSNIACAVQEPLLWIPSAMVVGGHNDIFKPVAGYLDFDRYEMIIYNRWGKEVFVSNNIEEGWDGSHNGSTSPEGVYVYVITFSAGDGQTIERTGSVTLLNGTN